MTNTLSSGAENVSWDLTDLYSGMDDPRLNADLDACDAQADALDAAYRGRIADLTAAELGGTDRPLRVAGGDRTSRPVRLHR